MPTLKKVNEFNWTLKSTNNKKFKLKVIFFNFLHFGDYANYIAIYDGEQKNQIGGLGHYEDHNIEYIFYSESDQILISCNFTFDPLYYNSYDYPSFYIEYEELDEPYIIEQTSTCDKFHISPRYEYIWTPNFHSTYRLKFPPYGNNLNCSWSYQLSPDKRFFVDIRVYAIGPNDVLSIYTGNSAKNYSLVNTHTNFLPPLNTLVTSYYFYSETDLYVTFKSDKANSALGFMIFIDEVDY